MGERAGSWRSGVGVSEDTTAKWQQYLLAAVISLAVGFFAIQWQQAESSIQELESEVFQLEQWHDEDIARLDEANRTRRNDIADIEERIARLEERTG